MASSYLLKTVRVCNSVGKIKYSLNNTNFFLRVFSSRFAFFETHSNEDDIHSKMNDYKITTIGRGLDKASTSYDTYLTDWDAWDESKFIKDHVYKIGVERVQGYVGVGRSNEPWTGSKAYTYQVIWEVPCKKLEKRF